MITLDLYQEVKDVLPDQGVGGNPIFTKKDIKTVIRIQNAQTIVLAGLISKKKSRPVTKVPILGDIPLIGFLFRRTNTTVTKTNLLVFITPHIVTNKDVADKLTDDSKENLKKNSTKSN
jgi:general secretion pathway protein D